MLKKTLIPWGLGLSLVINVASAAEPAAVNQWIPAEAVMSVEILDPKAILEPLLSQEMAKAVTALPAWQKEEATPKFEGFLKIVTFLETQMGMDWKTAVAKLFGGGVTFAAGPGGETLLCVEAQDEKVIETLQNTIGAVAGGGRRNPNAPGADREYRGATITSMGPKGVQTHLGTRLLFSNKPEVLEKALDCREGAANSLAKSESYQTARKAVGPDAVVFLYLDWATLKKTPKVEESFEKRLEPAQAFFFNELREAFTQANWVAAGLYIKDDILSLKIMTDSSAPSAKSFAGGASDSDSALPNLTVPGMLASMSFHRDLHGFYTAKDELFPERTSGLVFFENMMGIYFSGMDLTEGVLAEAKPDLRVVVADQEYDAAYARPAIEVPAFAAILQLKHPQAFGEVMEEAWQKAIGMASFTRGQKALPGFIIDRVPTPDGRISVASFRAPTEKAGADIRYNFRPSLARYGEYVIISSTDGLAKQLVDAVKKEAAKPVKPVAKTHSLMEISGPQVLEALLKNREQLVVKNMVDKGQKREKAEAEMDGLMALAGSIDRAQLSMGVENGHPQTTLELKLKYPDMEHIKVASGAPAAK